MNIKEIEVEVKPEDFPDSRVWRELVEKHGAAPFLDLMKLVGGEEYYIPAYDGATRLARKRIIEAETVDQI